MATETTFQLTTVYRLQESNEFLKRQFPRLPDWLNLYALNQINGDLAVGVLGLVGGRIEANAVAFKHFWSSEGVYDLAAAIVSPDNRGEGMGAGLVTFLHQQLVSRGGNTVLLNTNVCSQAMVGGVTVEGFWEKMGYRNIGETGILPGYFTGSWNSSETGRFMACQLRNETHSG